MSSRNRTCECGHVERRHGENDGRSFRRCGAPGCGCKHFGARRVCRRCAGLGIAFDYPPRLAQVLCAGVELITYKTDGPDSRLVVDENGNLVVDERVLVRVDLVYPGVRAHHRFESRVSRGFAPVATPTGLAAADLLRYAGDWICPWCFGSGQRSALRADLEERAHAS